MASLTGNSFTNVFARSFYPTEIGSREIPLPGTYILLQPDGSPIHVDLTPNSARVRHPVPLCDGDISAFQQRDVYLLVIGKPTFSLLDVNARHVALPYLFLQLKHVMQWIDKGYPNLITDTAPRSELGGASKIDSVQNAILLRSDLHNAWSDYLIAVLPDTLKLDHITDPNLRPLDELFRDHFLQCVLGMMGEDEDEDAFDDEINLSKDIWSGKQGKEHLEYGV
ncbi:hypothetical protein AX14_011341 [Amanita brunnescens Koide BX004]|nr:hypothetical protein AX14_011341 [Amanita brunnescens Koide BX004]